MVIRSGHTEEKQSCPHAERAENIPRFLLRCFKGSEETHRNAPLKWLYIFRRLHPHLNVCCSLLYKYNGRFEITVSGAVTCGGSPVLNIHCGIYIQNTKLCRPVTWVWLCCPTVLTQMLPFYIHTVTKAWLRSCASAHLILFEMKSFLSYSTTSAETCKCWQGLVFFIGWCEWSVASFAVSNKQ